MRTRGEGRSGIKAEWREAKQEFRELRHDLKAAIIEKIDASPEERQRVLLGFCVGRSKKSEAKK